MTPAQLNTLILPAALSLLGPRYDTPEARAMLIAIALQESGLRHRDQVGGTAKGLWQFEMAGVQGIGTHKATSPALKSVCDTLCYQFVPATIYSALDDNDILAAVCARLLLFSSPKQMPGKSQMMDGWALYNHDLWRPGKPRYQDWPDNWHAAWDAVEAK